ncbi:MAG: hypothetical protein AAGI38_20405 [Bacteroidota bacterium]
MIEPSLEYWNALANQLLIISSLLGGFSIAVLATLMMNKSEEKVISYLFRASTLAAGCFLACIFSMTKIFMMTTKGYPLPFTMSDLHTPRAVGGVLFMIGIICLSVVISLSGWVRSRGAGRFTTVVGVITFLIVCWMLT